MSDKLRTMLSNRNEAAIPTEILEEMQFQWKYMEAQRLKNTCEQKDKKMSDRIEEQRALI